MVPRSCVPGNPMLHEDPRTKSYASGLNPRLSFGDRESRGLEHANYRLRHGPLDSIALNTRPIPEARSYAFAESTIQVLRSRSGTQQ